MSVKQQFIKQFNHPTTQMLLAMVLFIVSALMVSDGKFAGWERTLFNNVYNLPSSWAPFFLVVTQFGGVGVLIALALIFLAKKRYRLVIRMLMAGLLADLLANVAKGMVGRPRPVKYISGLILRDPFVGGPGFPSGHTALATALALIAWQYLPRGYKWISIAWILGVGISRMYLGVHAPMDLVGGFAIGWFCVALFRHVRLSDVRK